MPSERYKKVIAHYKAHVGNDENLFDYGPKTHIYSAWPVSSERIVTIDVEGYSILEFGPYAGVKLNEYRDRELVTSMYVDARILQWAWEFEEIEVEMKWPQRLTFYALHTPEGIQIAEGIAGEPAQWQFTLKSDELEYIVGKLKPILDFQPLPLQHDPEQKPRIDANEYKFVHCQRKRQFLNSPPRRT